MHSRSSIRFSIWTKMLGTQTSSPRLDKPPHTQSSERGRCSTHQNPEQPGPEDRGSGIKSYGSSSLPHFHPFFPPHRVRDVDFSLQHSPLPPLQGPL